MLCRTPPSPPSLRRLRQGALRLRPNAQRREAWPALAGRTTARGCGVDRCEWHDPSARRLHRIALQIIHCPACAHRGMAGRSPLTRLVASPGTAAGRRRDLRQHRLRCGAMCERARCPRRWATHAAQWHMCARASSGRLARCAAQWELRTRGATHARSARGAR